MSPTPFSLPSVTPADQLLSPMTHHGACGCEANTGDGAGILTVLPCEFLNRTAPVTRHAIDGPGAPSYGRFCRVRSADHERRDAINSL